MMAPKFYKFWFPVIVYSVIIFGVSSVPRLGSADPKWPIDKVIHAIEYAILGFLYARALWHTKKTYNLSLIWGHSILFSVGYGVSDELHQLFVPGRMSSVGDLIADAVGCALGSGLYIFSKNKQKNLT